MGVCEVSAAIGQLWRGLGPEEKQRHNTDYTQDKVSVACVRRNIAVLFGVEKLELCGYLTVKKV